MSAKRLVLLTTKFVTTAAAPRPAPTMFCYTGLNTMQFHDPNKFTFTAKLQEHIKVIKNELMNLREVYKVNNYNSEDKEHVLQQGTLQWQAFWGFGKPNEAVRKFCPRTAKLLETIPELMTDTPLGAVYFSSLGADSSIKPHRGPCNIKLRCQLPLIVPGEGFIRVGGKFAQWEEGKMLIYDEAYEHELANLDSKGENVRLVFDIWHPELAKEERDLLIKGYKDFVSQSAAKAKTADKK